MFDGNALHDCDAHRTWASDQRRSGHPSPERVARSTGAVIMDVYIAIQTEEAVTKEREASVLTAKQVETLSAIRNSVVKLDEAKFPLMVDLLNALSENDRRLVRKELPTLFQEEESKVESALDGFSGLESTTHLEPARHKMV